MQFFLLEALLPQKNIKKLLLLPLGAGGAVNIHPELLPPFVELAPAYHPAPPVAVD